jgi:hypothetical protein
MEEWTYTLGRYIARRPDSSAEILWCRWMMFCSDYDRLLIGMNEGGEALPTVKL